MSEHERGPPHTQVSARHLVFSTSFCTQMANMLEGGGRTPLLPPAELAEMGFSIVAYPLSLIGVAAAAMRRALLGLRDGNIPPPEDLPSFQVGLSGGLSRPECHPSSAVLVNVRLSRQT